MDENLEKKIKQELESVRAIERRILAIERTSAQGEDRTHLRLHAKEGDRS
jgi:hypothetical protein